MADSQARTGGSARWSLAVVRGREPGRVYALGAGETIVGSASDGGAGLDLSDQEAGALRRMAGRHAAISLSGPEPSIRDLDTPGGTFVNRQRLLAGQSRRLQAGDMIQLGGVQLRVEAGAEARSANKVAAPAAAVAAAPRTAGGTAATPGGLLPVPFTMTAGASCRTWDDFLVLAAQRWGDLRDELASGRLAEHLRKIQRGDLVPRPGPGQSLDEQLDQWLGRLPTSRSSAPELEVHPEVLNVRAVAGGGIMRPTIRVSNTGYRLLRWTARVDPAGTPWIRLRPEQDGRPSFTVEDTDLPIEVEVPEVLEHALAAAIVLESNGGTRRVGVRIERPVLATEPVEPAVGPGVAPAPDWRLRVGEPLARMRPGVRLAWGVLGAIALRTVVGLAARAPVVGPGAAGSMAAPPLAGLAAVCAGLGLVAGGLLGRRRGDRPDLVAGGCAGGLLGLVAAAILHAMVRSLEAILGPWSGSPWAVGLLWAALGAILAGATNWFSPYRRDIAETPP